MLRSSRCVMTACLLVAAMASAGFAQTPAAWKSFASAEWRFHILLPGEPEVGMTTFKSYSGAPYDQHFLRVEKDNGNIAYLVSYSEIPAADLKEQTERGVTDEARLDACVKDIVGSMQAKLVAERPILMSGVAGKEFSYERPGGITVVYRICYTGARYYSVFVAWKGTAPAADDMNGFLDSFAFDR